jgi:hypothetical protein
MLLVANTCFRRCDKGVLAISPIVPQIYDNTQGRLHWKTLDAGREPLHYRYKNFFSSSFVLRGELLFELRELCVQQSDVCI